MISVAAMTGLLEAIRDAGADPDQVLRIFEVEPSVLANVDGFIPCSLFALILEEAARATGDDCFGLHFGERFKPKNIGSTSQIKTRSWMIYDRVRSEAARSVAKIG